MARNDVPPPIEHRIRRIRYQDLKTDTKETVDFIAKMILDSPGELDFQIRTDCFNVYYKGGSLWKVTNVSPRTRGIQIVTDHKYFKRKKETNLHSTWLPKPKDVLDGWISSLPRHKRVLDGWFDENNNRERQLQQELAVNHLLHDNSEWIVLDIEYTAWLYGTKENKKDSSSRRSCKFDLIGVKRVDLNTPGLLPIYVMELKQGNKSIRGSSSITSHAEDMEQLICDGADARAKKALLESIRLSFSEKQTLGLLPNVSENVLNRELKLEPAFILEGVDDTDELRDQKTNAGKILSASHPDIPWIDYDEMINGRLEK